MQVRLNKIHFPVTALGHGRRIGIWFQGCSIGCPHCVSRDTWVADNQKLVEVDDILASCRELADAELGGVTISGGEPFEQPDPLVELLDGLHAWRREMGQPIDFLCYSGLSLARLRHNFSSVLERLDALIPEPYVDRLPRGGQWRGSNNQLLVPLSDLGQERYAPFVNDEGSSKSDFQVMVRGGRIWLIGIPARGDMEKLEEASRARGVIQGRVSWRA
jgi:anaerobic ribonucleoside-triphosphate reductase activating protein